MASGGDDRRNYPRNVQELLKLCLEHTQSEDAPGSSTLEQMPEERRRWLEQALMENTTDPIQEMKKCIRISIEGTDGEDSMQTRYDALEGLTDICESIDFAQDFHKIGGYTLLPELLKDTSSGIRWRALEFMATIFQNNPYCQEAALEADLIPLLLETLDKDEANEVKVKALYALSCLIRGNENTMKVFLERDGFSVLMRAMQVDEEKLKTKGAFLLMDFCNRYPSSKDILCDMGMVEQLVGLLNEGHSQVHEHLMGALLNLVTDHQRALEESRRPELQLKVVLKQRVQELEGKEEFLEEKDYAEQLLKLCFGHGEKKKKKNNNVDR